MIHVCSLARLPDIVAETGARHVVTLLRDADLIPRLAALDPNNHLVLRLDDIASPLEGYVHPAEEHLERLIAFVQGWDRAKPLVVHCYAGISRSTASAFTAACALNPARPESAIAQALRRASPTASPNPLIVSHADRLLGRSGRMVAAVEAIGRGRMAEEAEPFRLQLE